MAIFLILTAVAAFIVLYTLAIRQNRNRLPLPPGPKPHMLLGNIRQMSMEKPWHTFASWGKTYGPLVHYRILNARTILLNSGKAALDLLESRSSIYSDRPRVMMMGELAGRDQVIFFQHIDNPRFRTTRRLLHKGLNPRATYSYKPLQMQETKVLLQNLLETPDDFIAHIRRNTGALVLKVAYGYQVETNDDMLVKLIRETFAMVATMMAPGKYLVEAFPVLGYIPSWFPGTGFKHQALQYRNLMNRVEHIPFEWTKKQIASGNFVESFTSKLLLPEDGETPDENIPEDIIKKCSSALYVAGADTTVSALTSFFMLMGIHPEVQKCAQEEVDSVAVGRLPTPDDYSQMPYVVALIKEIFRWGPPLPLGVAHMVTHDDVYEGYRIPKGAKILPNIWAITHDDELYPDPDKFDPSRHLGSHPQMDPYKFVFGFGRRICPGAHFAEISLFLNISSILALFNITKPLDRSGNEYNPAIEWTMGLTSHLKDFSCRIIPRSKEIHQILV